jgi:3-oxoacyl-[acyl-carrier protein] reductase
VSRTIVVTGGATGIGRAVAERFVADGAEVVITGRRADVLAKTAADLGARAVVCDAADPAQIQRSLEELPGWIDVLVNYGAAKAALATWNLDIAAELGARGITSNVVAPGFIAETEFFQGRLSDDRRKRLLEATMTHREGQVGDIAGTIFFLASPAARHLTGQVLQVNGGALTSR